MSQSASSREPGVITGLFRRRDDAEQAFQAAIELGYESSDISLIMSDETREQVFPDRPSASDQDDGDLASKAAEDVPEAPKSADRLGGPVGGTVGILTPVLGAVGTLLLIPGIVLAGPIAVALAAAGAVGVATGLAGVLANWGVPDTRIEEYEAGIREGGIVLGLKPRSAADAGRLRQQWRTAGGELVHT